MIEKPTCIDVLDTGNGYLMALKKLEILESQFFSCWAFGDVGVHRLMSAKQISLTVCVDGCINMRSLISWA